MQHSDFTTRFQYQADLDRAALVIERRDALDAAKDPVRAGEPHDVGFGRLLGSLRLAAR
jgi:hypothetical protein